MNSVIKTERLSKRHGSTWAVRDLNLQVPRGSLFGLLGPNGAGKSTTLNLLLGASAPTGGRIELFGEPWRREALARVGALINGPRFYGHLSVWENLKVHALLLRLPDSAIGQALAEVNLTGARDRRAAHLSTGMKVRLGLATALLGGPELLVLDEPQNGLDPEGIRELRTLLRSQVGRGATVVLSSHLLSEVAQLVDHVAILGGGELRYQGPIGDLVRPGRDLEQVYFDVLHGSHGAPTAVGRGPRQEVAR